MKKKKAPVFLIFYLFFLAVCIIFWVFVVSYVHKCLVRYEAAQPERLVEKLVERMQTDGASSLFDVGAEHTRFESQEAVRNFYDERFRGKNIVWQRDSASYNAVEPVYRIYADEEPMGVVTLRETSSEPLMFILSLSQWEVDSAQPEPFEGRESVTVTVPDVYGVTVNGVPLDEEDKTGEPVVLKQFQYARDYVDVPEIVEYRVQGLYEKPVIEIFDTEGNAVAYEETYEAGQTEITADNFPVTEPDSKLSDWVLANAERYTNFFSGDLPGCTVSTAPIADMFPADSPYLILADQYRREDMWMYSAHYTPTFENAKTSNYICYSNELFSIEVYFEKVIRLSKVNETRRDITHDRVFYGFLDGEWKILDIQTLLN